MSDVAPDHAPAAPRILIVDDERLNRQLMEVMLAGEGYDVVVVNGGGDALASVASYRPDLILLDVMMPGMNGYEVATALKSDDATRKIPIIMLTALDDRNSRLHGLGAGAEEFLTKPINRHELCFRIRNLLKLTER